MMAYLNLLKPMSLAFSLKHWRQMFKPYFLIKPVWEEQTRHWREPLPYLLGWENQTFSWAILSAIIGNVVSTNEFGWLDSNFKENEVDNSWIFYTCYSVHAIWANSVKGSFQPAYAMVISAMLLCYSAGYAVICSAKPLNSFLSPGKMYNPVDTTILQSVVHWMKF